MSSYANGYRRVVGSRKSIESDSKKSNLISLIFLFSIGEDINERACLLCHELQGFVNRKRNHCASYSASYCNAFAALFKIDSEREFIYALFLVASVPRPLSEGFPEERKPAKRHYPFPSHLQSPQVVKSRARKACLRVRYIAVSHRQCRILPGARIYEALSTSSVACC